MFIDAGKKKVEWWSKESLNARFARALLYVFNIKPNIKKVIKKTLPFN